MPSLRTFCIEFDRPSATYQVGESVTGNIIVDMVKDKSIRGIYFVAKGSSLVHWAHDTIDKKETYSAREQYFSIMGEIHSSSATESKIELKAGCHKYPFEFQLPRNIPTSFEDPHGYVRYTVKAIIERPWKFDHECKIAFTVVSVFDLNMHRDRCLGIHEDVQKNFSFCCFNQGAMSISIRVPSSGYVPGQRINALVNYINSSTEIGIMKISLKLERVLMFHATSNRMIDKYEITSTLYEGPFTTQGVANLEIKVPPIPPSHVPHCKIMDLDYFLKIVVHFTGSHHKIVRRYPLLIGSVPLYYAPNASDNQQVNATPYPTKEPATSNAIPMPEVPQPGTSAGNTQPPHIGFVVPGQANSAASWNIPPPSYEECMLGAKNILDHDESIYVQGANTPFRPKYPVFSYPAPNAPSF
ncbi:arrestin domain-containing protein 17-like [Augochlora pura]